MRSFDQFVLTCGGWLDGENLSPDSGLGSALKLGDDAVGLASKRLGNEPASPIILRNGLAQRKILNAVASKFDSGHAVALFWPLPLVMQGVAAAVWANPNTGPWIGNVAKLSSVFDYNDPRPPGFDFYLGAVLERNSIDIRKYRSGVRSEHIDSIVYAGDDRWEAFLATYMASIEFVWYHELAHVLYGHTTIAQDNFGVSDLFETAIDDTLPLPSALSQFMEYVADMDASLNMFATFYASMFAERDWTSVGRRNAGACIALGIVLSMYVLQESAKMSGRETMWRTHPPLGHRTVWVLSAETTALKEISRRHNIRSHIAKNQGVRHTASALLQSVALNHRSLDSWISPLNKQIEQRTNIYLSSLHRAARPYFNILSNNKLIDV